MPMASSISCAARSWSRASRGGSPGAATRRRAGERGPARRASGCGPAARSPRGTGARRPAPRSPARGERASIPSPQSVPPAGSSRPAAQRVGGELVLPARAAASTSSGSAHMETNRPRRLRWRAAPGQRAVVPAQAVLQDRGHPVPVRHRRALSRGSASARRPRSAAAASAWRPRSAASNIAVYGASSSRWPPRSRRSPRSATRPRRSSPRQCIAWPAQPGRAAALERAGGAGEPDLAGQQRVPGVVVPQAGAAAAANQPQRSPSSRERVVGERAHRPPQRRRRAPGPSVTSRARPSSTGRPGGAARRAAGGPAAGRPPAVSPRRPGARRTGRPPGVEVGLTRQRRRPAARAAGAPEQQRRSVAAAARGERDLPAQQVQPGARELVERPRLGRGQQLQRLSNAPACTLACAAVSARSASRAGSASAARRAPGTPPPRPARRGPAPGRRSAPAPRRRPRPGPAAAWARCQARRSGSACGSVTSASAACVRCRSRSDADR